MEALPLYAAALCAAAAIVLHGLWAQARAEARAQDAQRRAVLAELERTVEVYHGVIDRLGGIGAPAPAQSIAASPDAQVQARELVSQAAVEKGVAVLREQYRGRGIAMSDDELRLQARTMLLGEAPPV